MKLNLALLVAGLTAEATFGAASANALTYFLEKDLGVQDNQHLCRYSNGKVYGYNATDLCELSVEDDGPVNYGIQTSQTQTGFSAGESQDGMTKVCVYTVMGRKEAIRLGSVELCPLTHEF